MAPTIWFTHAKSDVSMAGPGDEIGHDTIGEDNVGLVIEGDCVYVVEGDPTEVLDFANRARQAVLDFDPDAHAQLRALEALDEACRELDVEIGLADVPDEVIAAIDTARDYIRSH